MSANAYEVLALAMRYVFAALMVLIVLRAWRISAVDSQRAKKLRRLSPETGIIGEMLVVNGGERARPGMRYPVTLEGTIGSGRRADIRLRHSSVAGRHAYYQMTDAGLFVRGHAHSRVRDGAGTPLRELVLDDGDILRVGQVSLMLVLTEGGNAPEEMHRHVMRRHRPVRDEANETDSVMDDSLFETGGDGPDAPDLFMDGGADDAGGGFDGDYDDFDGDFDGGTGR